jgi:integrase
MPVHKRRNTSGKIVWFYKFRPPGATRNATPIREFGFVTKQGAVDAEVARRIEEQKKLDLKKTGAAGVAATIPTTLATLLSEFMKQHAEEKLSPTTVEGYHRMIAYLSPELLAMNMKEITPLHLSREWARLVKSGGRSRKTKEPRAMKPKSVRNIAGLVSSAFARAIKWGLVTANPVTHSDLPRVKKRIGMALLPAEQDRLIQCGRGPWCLSAFLETCASVGARRGEVMALRWSDIKGTEIFIDRSLCQTKAGVLFKGAKTDEPRKVGMPPSLAACLEGHRLRQNEFRRQFGAAYRGDLDLIFANPDGSPLMPNSV